MFRSIRACLSLKGTIAQISTSCCALAPPFLSRYDDETNSCGGTGVGDIHDFLRCIRSRLPGCADRDGIRAGQGRVLTPEKSTQISCLQDFLIGKYEVTQGQWKAIMETNPSAFSDCGETCPVEQVSARDAQSFLDRLNAKTGKVYRLPTESEWEYAARGAEASECRNKQLKMI